MDFLILLIGYIYRNHVKYWTFGLVIDVKRKHIWDTASQFENHSFILSKLFICGPNILGKHYISK